MCVCFCSRFPLSVVPLGERNSLPIRVDSRRTDRDRKAMCAFYIYKRKSKTKNRNSRESGLQHANIASDIPAILADFGDLYLDSLFIPTSIFLRLLSPFLCWAIRRDPPPLSL